MHLIPSLSVAVAECPYKHRHHHHHHHHQHHCRRRRRHLATTLVTFVYSSTGDFRQVYYILCGGLNFMHTLNVS